MNGSRFDALTRAATRRTTRRTVVGGTGAGLAGAMLGATGLSRRVAAQDATPAADQATGPQWLFVQSAGATTLEPGAGGAHTLTMTEITAQTLYFSDRPARVAGTIPTEALVAEWGEAFADSPPNATLIGHLAEGEEAVVVELLDPVYDGAAGTLTYQVRILEEDEIGDRAFEQEPLTALDTPHEYTEAHLFIDDAGDCTACVFGFILLGITAGCDAC